MKQMNIIYASSITLLAVSSGCNITTIKASADAFIIKGGKPASVIVAPSPSEPFVQNAIDELQYHLQRASGTTLKVVDAKEALRLSADTVRIIVDSTALPVETYSVKSAGNSLTFTGDGGKSDALQWAVDYYLDAQLGVRWLWPGEVGTYILKRINIPLAEINHQGRPVLEKRSFRTSIAKTRSYEGSPEFLTKEEYKDSVEEAQSWLTRFQDGSRSSYKFGHAFKHWWEKYNKNHPEYFAAPPEGSEFKQPWPVSTRVKLRIGNPAVDDAIIAERKAAGAPDNWNVSPNDSAGFDTSAASRAMDDPPNQDPMTIWRSPKDGPIDERANLTARYVKFWNRLIAKMRQINPNVTLSSYAYSAYRYAPLDGLKVHSGIILGFVPSYWAREDWLKWQQAGAQLYLRPNWWHAGGVAPVLPLHQEGDFFKFAQSHNMIGFDSDSLMGYWATQGPLYYTIARLSVRPELSVDDVISEYCSAFGKAAPDIKNYLQYWEKFTEKAAYPATVSGLEYPPNSKGGLVQKLIEKDNLSPSYLVHGWQVIPYLYTDSVLDKGYAILNRADRDAAADNGSVKQRIQFLRDGLKHLALTRDVLKLGYIKKRTPEQETQYQELAAQLLRLRHSLAPKNVVWGEVEYAAEKKRRAPTFSEKITQKINVAVTEDG